MPGRSIRFAFLALAAWAVLFAPGAAAGDVDGERASTDADRVAAAIIAPTFGNDSVVVARPCRHDDQVADEDGMPAGHVPARLATPSSGAPSLLGDGFPRRAGHDACAWGAPPRAPPVD